MTNKETPKKKYDLEERTAKVKENINNLTKKC